MRAREWVVPLALGALAAGLVFVLPSPSLPERDPLPEASPEPLGLAWPFLEAEVPPDSTVALLAVGRPDDTVLFASCPDGERALEVTQESRALWRLGLPTGCRAADGDLRAEPAGDGPRFGTDDYNATRVTVYVFNEGGELLASNAGATQRNRFRLYGDFVTVSDKPWYLGDGPVPEGMRVPEGYVDFARGHLVGLPEGAVATAHLPTHEYDWLTGPLWVTARVDSVLPAP